MYRRSWLSYTKLDKFRRSGPLLFPLTLSPAVKYLRRSQAITPTSGFGNSVGGQSLQSLWSSITAWGDVTFMMLMCTWFFFVDNCRWRNYRAMLRRVKWGEVLKQCCTAVLSPPCPFLIFVSEVFILVLRISNFRGRPVIRFPLWRLVHWTLRTVCSVRM